MPDIIVIGGGMAGVSAAAALSETADVLLLEAEPGTGRHSTARSAAIFIRNYGNAALRALNDRSAVFFETPDIEVDAPLLTPRGEMMLATEDQLDLLDDYMAGSAGLERLTGPEAEALVPILKPGHVAAAASLSISWRIAPASRCSNIRRACACTRIATARTCGASHAMRSLQSRSSRKRKGSNRSGLRAGRQVGPRTASGASLVPPPPLPQHLRRSWRTSSIE